MDISSEKKLEILYDHYKESFSYIKNYEKQRERLLAFLIVVIFFQFLQIYFLDQSTGAFNAFIEKQINFSFAFNNNFFSALLWFILFTVSLRYFQVNILIDRQYTYVHNLEDNICKKTCDENFIIRERLGYKRGYKDHHPIFTNWVRIVYTWIFPIILVIVSFVKISLEGYIFPILAVKFVFFLAICTTTIFYMEKIHGKDPESSLNSNKSSA